MTADLRPQYAQVITDLPDELRFDLALSRYGGYAAGSRIPKDAVLRAFSDEDATVRFNMPDEVGSLHFL